MQNPVLKFRHSSVIWKLKIEKVENFHVFQLPYSLTFFTEILCTFPTYQCLRKSVWDFFILLRSWVIDKPGFFDCV